MRISDWSSDVCSSDLDALHEVAKALEPVLGEAEGAKLAWKPQTMIDVDEGAAQQLFKLIDALDDDDDVQTVWGNYERSEEHTSELQSLMRISYAVFCLKIKNTKT